MKKKGSGMIECEKGHIFCDSHVESDDDRDEFTVIKEFVVVYLKSNIKYYKSEDESDHILKELEQDLVKFENMTNNDDNYDELVNHKDNTDWRYSYPKDLCPICNLKNINDDVILSYIIKTNDFNKEEIVAEIREKFNTLEELKQS